MRNGTFSAGLAALLCTLLPSGAFARDHNGWNYTVSSYLWAAGLKADSAQFGLPETHVDLSFSDIIEDLDAAVMVVATARRDGFSLWGDLVYTNVSSNDATPYGVAATSVSSRTKNFIGTFGAGYALVENAQGTVDLVGGLRLWNVDSKLSFSGGLLDGLKGSDHATWVDALVGLRVTHKLNARFYLDGWALIGAGEANKDWDVAGLVGYEISERFSAVAGWRALGVDYSNDGFSYDAIQSGPIIGAVFRF